ncbi:MAG: CBS domain-containing protein [Phycisphaeraceae bacterium]|nr:CBS domain-containing protein [Phycisphaeraceae bacterium]
MNCPLCDHPNLPGDPQCESCGASLTQEDIPRAVTIFENHLQNDGVSVLEPRVPLKTTADTTLDQAVATMRRKSIGCLVVTDGGGQLVGLLSERDFLLKVALETPDLNARTVGEVMTRKPETVQESDPIAYALQRLMVADLRHLPVIDADNRPVGVITSGGVIRYVEEMIAEARREGKASG